MGKNLCDNSHGTGVRPLGNKAGNVASTFNVGRSIDISPGIGWNGDQGPDHENRRRCSGGNTANSYAKSSGNSLAELSNVDGRSGKKDGQRYGGSPAKSAKTRGPSGRKTK